MARGRFTFWLDYSKDEQLLLADTIDDLKRSRSFSSTIRIGIEIVCDLRKGKLDALFRHFPWVKAEWMAHTEQSNPSRENTLQAQLERLEKLLIAQGNTPIALPQLQTSTGTRFSLSAFDADLNSLPNPAANIFIEAVPEDPGVARKNFAAGMGNLFGDDDDDF